MQTVPVTATMMCHFSKHSLINLVGVAVEGASTCLEIRSFEYALFSPNPDLNLHLPNPKTYE